MSVNLEKLSIAKESLEIIDVIFFSVVMFLYSFPLQMEKSHIRWRSTA